MAYNYEYPYTDTSRVNSDWIIKRIIELSKEYEEFVIKNEIKYAEPIQWNISKQYEKYTVTTNDGKAYLSKKAVPSGIMITNTDYWLMISDYGTLYDRIKKAIVLDDDKNSTTTTKDREKGSLVWLNDSIYEVIRDMNIGDAYISTGTNPNIDEITIEEFISKHIAFLTIALSEEKSARENADNYLTTALATETGARENADNYLTTALQEESEARENKDNELSDLMKRNHWLFIGDSYNNGANSEGANLKGWGQRIIEKLNLTNSFSKGRDGCAFAPSPAENTYLQALKDLEDEVGSSLDKDKITDIMVCGGYNDAIESVATIEAGIEELMEYVKDNYSIARVHLGCIGHARNNTTRNTAIRNVALFSFKDYSVKYGGDFISDSDLVFHTYANFQSDDTHPNENGQEEIANCLANYVLSNTMPIYKVATTISGSSTSGTLTLSGYSQMDSNSLAIAIESIEYQPSVPFDKVLSGDPIVLGNITGGHITSSLMFFNGINMPLIFVDSSNVFTEVNCRLEINADNALVIRPVKLTNDGSGFLTLNGISRIVQSTEWSSVLDARAL